MSKTIEESKEEFLKELNNTNQLILGAYKNAVERLNKETQELQEQNAELAKELAHVVKALKTVSSFGATTPIIEHAEGILTKHNHLKSNTNG